MKIENTVALVTGAKRGIGAALVQARIEGGASKVYAAARQEADLSTVGARNDRRLVAAHLDILTLVAPASMPGPVSTTRPDRDHAKEES